MRSGRAKAGPGLFSALATHQTAATAMTKTGTDRTWAMLGVPPRTSSAAITTRLPVICAVNRPRLKNPITSTMPAITLSSGGRRLSNRSNSGEAFIELDSMTADIFSLRSGLRSCCAIEETIDDDLWNNEPATHSKNYSDSDEAAGDRSP